MGNNNSSRGPKKQTSHKDTNSDSLKEDGNVGRYSELNPLDSNSRILELHPLVVERIEGLAKCVFLTVYFSASPPILKFFILNYSFYMIVNQIYLSLNFRDSQ